MRVVALLTALGALALVPTAASGLVVRETRDTYVDFDGAGCGSTSIALLAAPRHARRVRPLAPRDGEGLRDIATNAIVARVETAVVRVHGHLAVRFTATGSDDACAQPAACRNCVPVGEEPLTM